MRVAGSRTGRVLGPVPLANAPFSHTMGVDGTGVAADMVMRLADDGQMVRKLDGSQVHLRRVSTASYTRAPASCTTHAASVASADLAFGSKPGCDAHAPPPSMQDCMQHILTQAFLAQWTQNNERTEFCKGWGRFLFDRRLFSFTSIVPSRGLHSGRVFGISLSFSS